MLTAQNTQVTLSASSAKKEFMVIDSDYVEGAIKDRIGWVLDGTDASIFGPERALLAYGRRMEIVTETPARIPAGRKRECYGNCVKALILEGAQDELFYAEGYATDRGGLWPPTQHGWLVDRQGRVIDPTWDDAADHFYYGVVFRTRFVLDMLEKADMEPGILSTPVLMRRNFGSPTLFQTTLEPRFHKDSNPFVASEEAA
jgi:hypothetical protein